MWYQCSDLDLQIFSCLVNERLWWRCCQWCRCIWCVLLLTIIVYLCSPFVSYLWDFPQVCVTLSVSGTSSTYIFTLEPHEHLHSIVCKKVPVYLHYLTSIAKLVMGFSAWYFSCYINCVYYKKIFLGVMSYNYIKHKVTNALIAVIKTFIFPTTNK